MTKVLMIAFMMIFTQNYVLVQFLAICPFLGVSQKFDSCIGMSGAVIFVMTLASAVTWCLQHFVLVPAHLEYLATIAFILVIAALVQFIEMFLRKFVPALYSALGIYLPLITTNCAVLGAALVNIQEGYSFVASVAYGFAAAIGFTMAIVVFAGVRVRLQFADPPRAFRGFPLTLVAAGLLAMAFSGFSGISF